MNAKERYFQYLQSEHWKNLRNIKIHQKGRCGRCGSTENLEVHHMHYKNWTNVQAKDLRVLCSKCHEKFHSFLKITGIKPEYKKISSVWNRFIQFYRGNKPMFRKYKKQLRNWKNFSPRQE